MEKTEALKAVAKADEIAELLEHVGWQDHLKPALAKLRENAVQQLIRSTLGLPNRTDQTPQQAAGVVYGIDFILSLIEAALVKGDKAHHEISRALAEYEKID